MHWLSSKWWFSGIRFKVGRNSIVYDENPTWWHLGRIAQIKNTRVWETQDRIGSVWLGDSSEENRTWLPQIENDGEKTCRAGHTKLRICARNGNYERIAVVKNQGTKQRVQRILGDCRQCESNGQCSRGDNCSFRYDISKRGKLTLPNLSPSSSMRQSERTCVENSKSQGKVPVVECFDCPARITSKELAPIHSEKSGTLQNACSTRPRVVAD